MSNRLVKLVSLTAVPQVASGTVPAAQRFVFGPRKTDPTVADNRFIQTDAYMVERSVFSPVVKVLTAGAHVTFTMTVEGSVDGVTWIALQFSVQAPLAGITVDANGVSFSAAIGLGGVTPRLLGGWPYYRVGLAGDNVAANGTAQFGILAAKE